MLHASLHSATMMPLLLCTLPRSLPRAALRKAPVVRCLPVNCDGGTSRRKKVLFLSPVWPERSSSAAGVRTADLIDGFREWGYDASYGSPSKPNSHSELLEEQGVSVFQVLPNREEELASVLQAVGPTVCIFDRFYAEEAFSFRVRELAPQALRVLDMQDVHFLRAGRQELATKQSASIAEVMRCRPDASSAECLRELAAIHRSDLTLVCSPEELRLLVEHYGIPEQKLVLAPFFSPPSPYAPQALAARGSHGSSTTSGGSSSSSTAEAAVPASSPAQLPCPTFEERRHFMMIGNFKHPPNLDSVEWACREVWPLIRARLASGAGPGAGGLPELHIYGAYPPGGVQRLHKPKEGVHLKGFAPSLDIMLRYRVSLAPLRYGAGLKGKVVDSWWHGLPVCTTPIGAEGMTSGSSWSEERLQSSSGGDGGATSSDGANGSSSSGRSSQPADPAEEGYIWQLGPEGQAPSSGSGRSQGSTADPASEGDAWQLGPEQQQVGAVDPAAQGHAWQLGPEQQQGTAADPAVQGHAWQLGPHKQKQEEGQVVSAGSTGAEWGGLWRAESAEQLAENAVQLYSDPELWVECQARGFELLQSLYGREHNLGVIRDAVQDMLATLEHRRATDFTGQMLWQQQFRATEFMSRWIELKERGPPKKEE